MAGRLEGKVAIVSGAGSSGPGFGVGRATSILFAREGAQLLLVDNVPERVNETVRLLEQEGHKAVVAIVDVTEADAGVRIVNAALTAFGRIDVLVNVAAISPMEDVLTSTPEFFDEVIALNTRAPFLLSKAAIPAMAASGGGVIANITSIAAIRNAGGTQTAYAASKAALLGMMNDIAWNHGRDGIRINCISPGHIATPMRALAAVEMGLEHDSVDMGHRTALGFEGDAWDIAKAAAFLCSDDARYITAVHLPVDGGASVRSP